MPIRYLLTLLLLTATIRGNAMSEILEKDFAITVEHMYD